MIPGFVVLYRDKEKYIHLYFFPGISENYKSIYRPIDLSKINIKYEKTINKDNSVDVKFLNKSIKNLKINCKLISVYNEQVKYETLSI